ncbi:MAG TPA: PorT family protein [Flavobacteriia bacterium]|nr:PorT family protein [Flavobacteriia bacterium]
MKKIVVTSISILFYLTMPAQLSVDYGVKAGLNYNGNGNLTIVGTLAGLNEKISSENEIGYQLGFYTQVNFTKIFIRPELILSHTKNSYNNILALSSEFKMTSLEFPVLVGFSVIKPLHLYAGPSLQYIINTKFAPSFDLNIENTIAFKYAIGADIQLHKFTVDLRYTSNISENLASFLDQVPADGAGYFIETKSNQLILSFAYQLN